MNTVEVSTLVYLPPEEVFDFLVDFPRYADYSKHLDRVTQHGTGGVGTTYDLRFTWWKLSYTAHTEVTAIDPPETLDWEVTREIHAHGKWIVEHVPEEAPSDRDTASRVRLQVTYNPDSVHSGVIKLPRFISFSWVVDRVVDLIVEEGERVVARIVEDLEGERRPVTLDVVQR